MSDDICGAETTSDKPCQNPAGEDGSCWIPSHNDPDAENPHGRPSKLEDRREDIMEAAERGLTLEGIARAAGVGVSTLREWRTKHDDFSAALKRARARAEVDLIEDASAEFVLERSYDYTKSQEVELSGEVGLSTSLSEDEKELLDEAFGSADGDE
jgi:AcrR family transcriptional regulator